jgi:hypothetical protein
MTFTSSGLVDLATFRSDFGYQEYTSSHKIKLKNILKVYSEMELTSTSASNIEGTHDQALKRI